MVLIYIRIHIDASLGNLISDVVLVNSKLMTKLIPPIADAHLPVDATRSTELT